MPTSRQGLNHAFNNECLQFMSSMVELS